MVVYATSTKSNVMLLDIKKLSFLMHYVVFCFAPEKLLAVNI